MRLQEYRNGTVQLGFSTFVRGVQLIDKVSIEDWLKIKLYQGSHPKSRERYFVQLGDRGFIVTKMDNGEHVCLELNKEAIEKYKQEF